MHPFKYTAPPLSVYEYVKIIVLSGTLFPFRLASSLGIVVVSWAYAKFVMWFWSVTVLTEEQKTGKEAFPWFVQYSLYPVHYLFRMFLFIWGFVYFNVKGKFYSKKEAPLIVANHVSCFEPFILGFMFGGSAVARSEEITRPFMGVLFRSIQCLFVDRKDKNSREKIREGIRSRALNDDFPTIILFPEGTTTNNCALMEFKTGAFSPGVNVQPVIVSFRRNKRWPIIWVPGLSLLYVIWRTGTQLINYVDIELCPPYKPSEEEKKDAILYANNVRNYFAKKMQISSGKEMKAYSFFDVLLTESGRRDIGFEFTPKLLCSEKISKYPLVCNNERNDFLDCLAVYKQFEVSKDGKLKKDAFVQKFVQEGVSQKTAESLFKHANVDQRGWIEYHNFLDGIHLLRETGSKLLKEAEADKFFEIYQRMLNQVPKKLRYARA